VTSSRTMASTRAILQADLTWTGYHFTDDVQVEVLDDGRIGRVGAALSDDPERLEGHALLPGFVNAHSHAFQRGLRGLGERFPDTFGTFWSWREAMYDLVGSLDADATYGWSLRAFEEMRRAGITAVGEFHYLHHGAAGDDFALDQPVIEAARKAGIRLALLYVYYASGGFNQPLQGAQERFRIPSPEAYWRRIEALTRELNQPRERLGAVVHSVRAAELEDLVAIHREARRRNLVFHIHLEEQRREIEQCREVHGLGPMALLVDRLPQLSRTVGVHCTHSAAQDLEAFARAGGTVCLCPLTEANLADGVPDLPAMLEAGVRFSLGTDSNARISMLEEMRWMEYVQRLAWERRGVVLAETGEVARRLLTIDTAGGAAALGLAAGAIGTGRWADFTLIDLEHPSLDGATEDTLAEALVFGADNSVIAGTAVASEWD
jgi:formimidoylglutamate deiminase